MAPRALVRVKKKKKKKRNLDALESMDGMSDEVVSNNMFEELTKPNPPMEEQPDVPMEVISNYMANPKRRSIVDTIAKPFVASERNILMARHRRQSIMKEAQPKSCMYLDMNHPVRKFCLDMMSYPSFDRSILLLIVANSICLAVEDPLSNTTNPVLETLELVFNILFTIEMTIKMIGLGVWGSKSAYWSDGWNRMDSFVVFMGWLPNILQIFMGGGAGGAGNFTAIRVVRILKVLKTIQRVEGVRKLVTALLSSLPLLMNVGNLLGFMFFVFGIFGLQLFMSASRQKCFYKDSSTDFDLDPNAPWTRVSTDDWDVCGLPEQKGAFTHCNDDEICSSHTPLGADGSSSSAIWNYAPEGNIGFDNIFMSFLTILTTMSLEGWIDVMNMCWDTIGFVAVPYFIAIVVFGSLFAINLVVAVIYEAYQTSAHMTNKPDDSLPTEIIMMEEAKRAERAEKKRLHDLKWSGEYMDRWRRAKEVVTPDSYALFKAYASFRDCCYDLGANENFGVFITSSILLNTLFMSMEFHGASPTHRYVLEVANMVFTVLFTAEMAIKLVGMNIRNYFRDPYNKFDAFIVLFSWIEYSLLSGGGFSSLRTFRLLRVLRTLKLAKSWYSLNQLIITIARSIPGLANFGLILCLFLFIYALFGMQFYGGEFNEANGFDERPRAHFDSLPMSLLTVFQVVTGENWNDVLYACMKVNGVVGAVYASSMFCLGNYIVLNLFLAILLDNFQQAAGEAKKTFYEEMEKQNDVKIALNKFKSFLITVGMGCIPRRLRTCKMFMKANAAEDELKRAKAEEESKNEGGEDGEAAVSPEEVSLTVPEEGREEERKPQAEAPKPKPKDQRRKSSLENFSRQISMWFSGQDNSERLRAAAEQERTRAMTEQLILIEDKEKRKRSSSIGSAERKKENSGQSNEIDTETDSDSEEEEQFTGLKATQYHAHYHPKNVRSDDLSTFVLENAYQCLLKIHTNVLELYKSNDHTATANDEAMEDMDSSNSLLTNSVRASVQHSRESQEGVEMVEMNSGASSASNDTKRENSDSIPIKAKASQKLNLESARHEAMMDEDLKNEFRMMRNFMKLLKRSIDVRTRRLNAKTFMDSFTGGEVRAFLMTNKVVKDFHTAEKCAQMLLEIGFINLSIPPKEINREASASLQSQQEIDITYRSRGASVLAMEWEGDSLVFGADHKRLYTIGDITPSTMSLMSPTNIQGVRKAIRKRKKRKAKMELILKNKTSLMCLGKDNSLRQKCAEIVCDPWFDQIILALICISSVNLALDEPHVATEKGPLYQYLYYSDFVMTGLFVIEMLLKIISMGFFFGKGAYLKVSWNKLDFVIVLVSIAGIILDGKVDLAFLKSLRAMRGLRPLRMVSRAPSLKVVVNAIFIALPACVNVVLVVLLCFLIFAIVGSTFFSGLFFYCKGNGDADKYGLDRVDCIGNYTDGSGVVVDREWVRYPYHFDSVPRAMTTLFEIASLEMWPDIMSAARDVTDIDMAPTIDASLGYAFYFVIFIFIGSFFVINLFVGVVINKFSQVKAEGDGESLFLSKEQQEWVKAQKAIMSSTVTIRFKSPMELNGIKNPDKAGFGLKVRTKIFNLVESSEFDAVIMTTIMVSILSMAMPYHNMSKNYELGLFYVDFVWNGIFILEMLLKWIGLNLFQYMRSGWNRFDCFIVLLSIADMIASSTGVDVGVDIKILRVLRIARMVRLLRHNKPLMNIFIALWTSLPSLGNVGSVLLLCLYVYAVMGMNLFSDVTVDKVDGLEFISERINFSTFGYSMLTLFRTSTGESWNGIMHELESQGHTIAIPYFVSFVVMGTFIMLNLFIAVILENFADAQSVSDKNFSYEHIEEFSSVWADLDTEKDYFLESFKLVNLLYRLEAPMGLKGQEHIVTRYAHEMNMHTGLDGVKRKHVIQHIRELGIRRDKYGQVFFLDVMSALVRKGFGMDGVNLGELDSVSFDQINKKLMSNITPELKDKLNAMESTQVLCDLTDEFNAASVIQCVWRGKIERRDFFERVKRDGKWTKRLDHMYTETLHIWKEGSDLMELEEQERKRRMADLVATEKKVERNEGGRPLTPEEELEELLDEADEHIVKVRDNISPGDAIKTSQRKASVLAFFGRGGKAADEKVEREKKTQRFNNL